MSLVLGSGLRVQEIAPPRASIEDRLALRDLLDAYADAVNRADSEARLRQLSEKDAERLKNEQDAKTRGMLEAEARHRHEAEQARRRADEAAAAAQRAEQARSDREDYDERARKAAEKKAEQEKKNAAPGAKPAADSLLPTR